jgi:hypothetical protein
VEADLDLWPRSDFRISDPSKDPLFDKRDPLFDKWNPWWIKWQHNKYKAFYFIMHYLGLVVFWISKNCKKRCC